MGRRNGFSLIEFLIVIGIISIVAAIAVPNLLSARAAANERSASGSLRHIAISEIDFKINDRDSNLLHDYWTGDLSGLYRLQNPTAQPLALVEFVVAAQDGNPLPEGGAGGAIGPDVAPRSAKSGYWIMAMAGFAQTTDAVMGDVHHFQAFAFIAYPESYASAGRQVFLVSQEGVVYRRDPGGDVIVPGTQPAQIQPAWLATPADPLAAGWDTIE